MKGMTDIKKDLQSVVVLAAAPGRLQETERFLSRRGWVVRSRADLKSFLSDVATLKPRYVLISVDFSHPNLAQLRQTVAQIYRVQVIDFAEDQGAESWSRLKALENPHKILGQLTGPAFERVLARMAPTPDLSNLAVAEAALREKSVEALDRVFDRGDGAIRRPVSWTSRVSCVQVRTPLLSGHFVVALGSDKTLEQDLQSILQDALRQMFLQLGLDEVEASSYPMDIRRVEFKRWALDSAAFLERTAHQGVEVAMAFFPADAELFSLQDSHEAEMASLSIDEIRPEHPVDFELYLHLPLNGRFVLYVSKGGWMSLQQQMTLQGRGISRLHVRRRDESAIHRDRVHRRLDRLITDFYEGRAA